MLINLIILFTAIVVIVLQVLSSVKRYKECSECEIKNECRHKYNDFLHIILDIIRFFLTMYFFSDFMWTMKVLNQENRIWMFCSTIIIICLVVWVNVFDERQHLIDFFKGIGCHHKKGGENEN